MGHYLSTVHQYSFPDTGFVETAPLNQSVISINKTQSYQSVISRDKTPSNQSIINWKETLIKSICHTQEENFIK